MTKEIENLVKNIDTCISERDAMLQKKAELKMNSAKVILENFENFFFPEANELHKLLKNFGEKRVSSSLDRHLTYEIGGSNFTLSPHSNYFWFLFESNGCAYGWYSSPESLLSNLTEKVNNATKENTSLLELLLTFFGTEDSTLKVLDSYRDAVEKALQSMNDNIRNSNYGLSELLDKMQNILSNTHSVTEKEDGTIELQINGKTYIGTVKEA